MKKNDSTIKLRYDSHIKVCDNEQHGSILVVGNFYGMFCEANSDGYIPYLSECSEELVDNLMWLLVDNADAKHVFVGVKDNISEYVRNLRKCAEVLFGVNIKDENWIEYLVDSDDELLDCLNKVSEEMPKFDYIIQNPPYNKNLHIQFFNKGLDILSDTGKMTIIEPATWLMNLRQNSPNVNKLFSPLKERVKGRVEKIVIENLNGEFGTVTTVPFSITHINNAYNGQTDFTLFGTNQTIDFDNCSHILHNDLVYSILHKIEKCDKVCSHLTDSEEGWHYIRKNDIVYPVYAEYFVRNGYFNSNKRFKNLKIGNYHGAYTSPTCSIIDSKIYDCIPKCYARGGSTANSRKYSDRLAECVYGSYEEMTNYRHYVLNNTLPLFINICMTIDQNNNSLKYVPWLVDKQYTDQEIYEMFHFTEQEINLIEKTIRKYEHSSPFFKRTMCGPKSVSDQEVQKFCDELDKEFPTE